MNKKVRKLLFVSGLAIIIIAICVFCFIVGRGHSVYLDNKTLEGTPYESYNEIEVIYKGESVTKLAKAERFGVTMMGQKLNIQFNAKKKRNSMKETYNLEIEVPYNLDGIVINVPAYIEGADQSVFMSEFVPISSLGAETDEEVPVTDEFGMTVTEEE